MRIERRTRDDASILHADLDSFYASVEQRDNPALRGRPVLVGGGVVLAASYEAKAFGVRSPMPGHEARALCPRAIVVPPRFDAYVEASRAVFEIFHDTTPIVEGISVDVADARLGGSFALFRTGTYAPVRMHAVGTNGRRGRGTEHDAARRAGARTPRGPR